VSLREETRRDFADILATFSGADGGVDFVRLRALIEDMDQQATQGVETAEQVIQVMRRFARLIVVARKAYFNPQAK
jgi:hypothetical protein